MNCIIDLQHWALRPLRPIARTFLFAVIAVGVFGIELGASAALAQVTAGSDLKVDEDLRPVQRRLLDRKADFASFVERRERERREDEVGRQKIKQDRLNSAKLEAERRDAFVAVMKRYSMEEVERLEAQDEERIDHERFREDVVRGKFVEFRDRSQALEREIGDIDPYLELDIDLKKAPESKTSWTEQKTGSGEGKESF